MSTRKTAKMPDILAALAQFGVPEEHLCVLESETGERPARLVGTWSAGGLMMWVIEDDGVNDGLTRLLVRAGFPVLRPEEEDVLEAEAPAAPLQGGSAIRMIAGVGSRGGAKPKDVVRAAAHLWRGHPPREELVEALADAYGLTLEDARGLIAQVLGFEPQHRQ